MGRVKLCMFLAVLFLAGCATTNTTKSADLEQQGLKNQLTVLEAQVKDKDQQIAYLQEALDKESKEKAVLAEQSNALQGQSKTSMPKGSIKQVQLALKKAGYDPGPRDGRVGSRTRKAIRHFQQDKKLPITGKVDKETWTELMSYLEQKSAIKNSETE